MQDIKHTRKSSLRLLKLLFVNLILLLIFIEIVFYAYFRSPIRFYYPFFTSITDIHENYNVTYISDFKTGHRLVKCQNNEQNKEILFVGDSFTWGGGLEMRDTFASLYSCQKKGYLVKNFGSIGIGINEYKKILKNYNLKNTKTIYLVFFDNDFARINNPIGYFQKLKSLLRFRSFNFQLFKKLKNKINLIRYGECIKVNGFCNGLATNIAVNPYGLKDAFEIDSLSIAIIDEEMYQMVEHINQKSQANLIALVIPDPSVVSQRHTDFYSKIGSLYIPKFRELSPVAKKIKLLSHELNFKYLPFYEHVISVYEENDNPNLYFDHDAHMNRNGNYELFRYIVNYEESNQ